MYAYSEPFCPIVGCKYFKGAPSNVRFFFVSKRYSELVQKWVKSIRTYMPDFPDDISNNRICQLHFDPDDLKLSRGELQLRFGAIPTRFPRSEPKQWVAPRIPASLQKVIVIRKPNESTKQPSPTAKDPLTILLKPPQNASFSGSLKCKNCTVQIEAMQKRMHELEEQIKEQKFEIANLNKRNQYLKKFEPACVKKTAECSDCKSKLTPNISDLMDIHTRTRPKEEPDIKFHQNHYDEYKQMQHPQSKDPLLKPFQCGHGNCCERFISSNILGDRMNKNHVPLIRRSDHIESGRKTGKKAFECFLCREFFETFTDTRSHMKKHSPIGKLKARCSVCWTKLLDNQVNEHLCEHIARSRGSVDCEYCPEKTTSIVKLFRHIDVKHAKIKTLYRCITNCPSTFPVKSLIEYHRVVHTQEIYKCNKCSSERSFQTLHALNQHIKRHEAESVVLCDECGKAFKSNQTLRTHKLLHGSKLISCEKCPKKFFTPLSLKKHQSFHSNQTYSCDQCPKKCSSSYRLLIHIKRHTQPIEKRFECSQCTVKFTKQSNLNRHLSDVHTTIRQFQCSHCSRSYKHRGDLNKHLRMHLGDDMYACPESGCSKRFRLPLDLQKHASEHYVERRIKT